jgi:hypothetical protein
MMVPAVSRSLAGWGAAKFSTPDDEGVFEQATLLEIA